MGGFRNSRIPQPGGGVAVSGVWGGKRTFGCVIDNMAQAMRSTIQYKQHLRRFGVYTFRSILNTCIHNKLTQPFCLRDSSIKRACVSPPQRSSKCSG